MLEMIARKPSVKFFSILAVSLLFAAGHGVVGANETPSLAMEQRYDHWPENLKINGRIIVHYDLEDPAILGALLDRVARDRNVLVLETSERLLDDEWLRAIRGAIGEQGSIRIASADNMPDGLESVDCVIFAALPGDNAADSELAESLQSLLQRGGTIVVDQEGGNQLGMHSLASHDSLETEPGWNLLPDCIFDSSLGAETMLKVLDEHPRSVGVTLTAGSALVLSGRKLVAYGNGGATVSVAKGTAKKPATVTIAGAENGRRRNPESYMADLTQWRRMAIDRDLPPFPGETPPTPAVENGTLIIVGGGGSPRGMMSRFVELAGGVENARLVYVPCSEAEDVGEQHGLVESWKRMGVQHATFIHTKDRNRANTDESFLEPLKNATGIYFGGGRQWNFADSYYGTKAHALMKDVLRRGGVIGGSSAGASIQGRYLARATPIGNFKLMAPGYERGGLGFLPGVAIDQHFTQRGRQKDMTGLIQVYPQLLGIGLDEATAIEVQKSVAKVSGRGRAFFYDANAEREEGDPDYIALPDGSSYDLAKRVILKDTRQVKKDAESEPTETSQK